MKNSAGPRLSKSLFTLGMDCPTKLFYAKTPGYINCNSKNDFLKSLADGGFQVGALAQCQFPEGHRIDTINIEQALGETNEWMKRPEVTLFEAAIAFENLLIRADVLVKKNQTLYLYEVKAKSWSPENSFVTKKGKTKIATNWQSYVYDVAFQTYVLKQAFPTFNIVPHLMLVDKSKTTSIDSLNQKFKIQPMGDHSHRVQMIGDVSLEALGRSILTAVPVDEEVEGILNGSLFSKDDKSFTDWIQEMSRAVEQKRRWPASLGTQCKTCEYRATPEEMFQGKLSGFHQCWGTEGGLSPAELKKPTVLELWNFRAAGAFIEEGRLLMEDLTDDDFPDKEWRQYLQYQKTISGDPEPFVDADGLRDAMSDVVFPLHFIDFETSMLALPFHKGRHPYEQYAFQFSHHQMEEDGSYQHKDQFLHAKPGMFPNFEFVRALKGALENDEGTVFRYANHENTVLNQICAQLEFSAEPDKKELIAFCNTLTHDTTDGRTGERNMVDLWAWVKLFYYHPLMKGSNSIKSVFPALLNTSSWLQKKYSKPVYGDEITSLNFEPVAMVQVDSQTNEVISPYKNLPPVMDGMDTEEEGTYYRNDEVIKEGGAAASAFARLQLSDVPEKEREQIEKSLLRYCEIDTLAMVMIWEAWREMI
ncbi:MAG TPA: DUF2779 domain-containing protein [Treponemataceae bacterium]|nr:DUF2779 domain-containing protein [Treponemataceae bacterium]